MLVQYCGCYLYAQLFKLFDRHVKLKRGKRTNGKVKRLVRFLFFYQTIVFIVKNTLMWFTGQSYIRKKEQFWVCWFTEYPALALEYTCMRNRAVLKFSNPIHDVCVCYLSFFRLTSCIRSSSVKRLSLSHMSKQMLGITYRKKNIIKLVAFFNARRWFGPQTQWRPLRKTFTSELGLDDLSLAWSAVVQLVAFFNSGSQWF